MAEEVKEEIKESPPPKEEKRDEVTVSEMLSAVQGDIDKLQDKLEAEFEKKRNALLIAKPRKEYFIVKNKFWDAWFQKLFAQIISVKIWVMALITVLLGMGLITNVQFAALFGIIMGLKGTFQVADAYKRNGNGKPSAMDKT
jgi:hypothetical protein